MKEERDGGQGPVSQLAGSPYGPCAGSVTYLKAYPKACLRVSGVAGVARAADHGGICRGGWQFSSPQLEQETSPKAPLTINAQGGSGPLALISLPWLPLCGKGPL